MSAGVEHEIPGHLQQPIQEYLQRLATAQTSNVAIEPRYAQMLWLRPGDAARLGKPPHRDIVLAEQARLPTGVRRCRVDEYVNPHRGAGYTVTIEWTDHGKQIQMIRNVGPERWRDKEPHEV